jgi:hypothetical protein
MIMWMACPACEWGSSRRSLGWRAVRRAVHCALRVASRHHMEAEHLILCPMYLYRAVNAPSTNVVGLDWTVVCFLPLTS